MRRAPSFLLALAGLTTLTGCARAAELERKPWAGFGDGGRDASSNEDDGSGDGDDPGESAGDGDGDGDSQQDRDAGANGSIDASEPDGGCTDGDQDGTDDCAELADGDDWTDPTIFNGVKARWKAQCSNDGSCSENDSRSKVDACMAGELREELNQYAGWDWDDPPDNLCDEDYGFLPNWNECAASWQAQWLGFINVKTTGHHCFAIAGETDEGCGALFFDSEDAPTQSGAAAKCYQVPAGVYPIMWHYTMDNGSQSSLHVLYCSDAAADCVPSAALPATLLRPTQP